ncbi:MAG TPA: hypothetical protein VIG30_15475, partial [Ktedonobacterales bacterium]
MMRLSWWPRARWARVLLALGLPLATVALIRLCARYLWPNLSALDPQLYHRYALAFWTGPHAFQSLPVEYPPLAVLPFGLTLVPPLPDYLSVFMLWMGALLFLGYLALLRFTTPGRALAYLVYLTLGTAATVLARYDLVVALITLAALWAAGRRRFALAYVLLAVGIPLKLYPAFLLPLVVLWHGCAAARAAERADGAMSVPAPASRMTPLARIGWTPASLAPALLGALFCLGIAAAGFVGAALLSGGAALSSLTYASARPIQVESTPATLLWLGSFLGFPARADFSYGSNNITGPLADMLSSLALAALVAGCVWVYWRLARGRLTLGQAFVACLCVVLVTNKIFSAQYLIWVLPFIAAVEGADGFDLSWLMLCLLSAVDYPFLFHYQVHHQAPTYSALYMLGLA